MAEKPRKRRLASKLDDLPGLFDSIEIDVAGVDTPPAPPKPAADPLLERMHAERTAHASAGMDISPAALNPVQTLRFISFGSGSSGNCAYIGTEKGGVLIDAGVDPDHVKKTLAANNISLDSIAGILLTHDHSDHVRYAYNLLRTNRHMLLYCTPRTLSGLLRRHSISRRIKDYHKPIYKEFEFDAADLKITAFETSHDGSDNVGFYVTSGDKAFVVATDMGVITERADHYMRLANYLMLESNYDLHMLRTGSYPEYLKARIAGERGHLDNTVAAAYAAGLESERLSHIFLCHLSNDNNTPDIALRTMREALTAAGRTVIEAGSTPMADPAALQLSALPRYEASPLYVLRKKT